MKRLILAGVFAGAAVAAFRGDKIVIALSSLFAAICFLWLGTYKSQRIPLKAAHAIAPPLLCGVGGVLLLLFIFNFIPEAHNLGVVSRVEDHLLLFQEWLAKWTGLSVLRSLAVLAFFAVVSLWFPSWKLVSRWRRLNTWAGRTATALTIIASFTFTSSVSAAVALAHADSVIAAHFQSAKTSLQSNERQYLAAATIKAAALTLPSSDLQDFAEFFRAGQVFAEDIASRLPPNWQAESNWNADTGVEDAVATDAAFADADSLRPADPKMFFPSVPAEESSKELYSEQINRLASEEAAADQVETTANQMQEAAREAFSTALDASSDPIRKWAQSYVDALVNRISASIAFIPDTYVNELLGAYKDAFVNLNVQLVRKAMSTKLWLSAQRSATQLAANLKASLPQILDRALHGEGDRTEALAEEAELHGEQGQSDLAQSELQSASESLDRAHLQAHLEAAVSSAGAIFDPDSFDGTLVTPETEVQAARNVLGGEVTRSGDLDEILKETLAVTGTIAKDLEREHIHVE